MKRMDFDLFRLEDRVLFEAAAVAEIVEAAEAAQENPNANVNEAEKQAQEDRDALKNAPPENPADQAGQSDGEAQSDPAEAADIDAQVEQLIQGEIPVTDGDVDVTVPELGDSSSAVLEAGESGNLVDALIVPSDATISSGRELVVINGTVPDRDAILAELKLNQEVLILEDGTGLAELNKYLDAHEGKYDAIHLVTHGNEGYIFVNSEKIDADNFDSAEWKAVGEHLTDDGDILLYGCNTAETDDGRLLVVGDYGFRFVSERLFAGYFTEFGGRRFHRPQLLILEKTDGTMRELHLPLAAAPETVAIPACNVQITVVPQPEAIDAPFTPAARFSTEEPPFDAPAPPPAEDVAAVIPEPAASFPAESFSYRREWNLERCSALPDGLRGEDLERMRFTADGVQLKPNAGLIVEQSSSFRKRLYLECVFRLDQMPEWSNQYMEDNILVASDKGRTVELRFNLAMNGTRFLIPMATGSLEDIQELTVPVEAGKWYHVIAGYDNGEQFLEINGRRISRKRTGELRAPVMPWRVCPKLSATIRFLRIAGE